jgi:predicted phage terminase large subunit-like protein
MQTLTAEAIYGLVTTFLMEGFDSPKPIPDVHMEMWDLVCSDHPQVAIAAPRGHAKSTSITHSYVIANALFRVKDYIIIISDTESQACEFLGDIKKEFIENQDLIDVFGFDRFVKDNETEVVGRFKNGDLFRILAKGSEQKIRGRKWRGKRPNLIVGDDLENDEIVMNDERRAKFRKWMDDAVVPALSDDGIIRLVGTILHFDSYLERQMPSWGDEQTHTDGIKWWSTKEDPIWHAVRYQSHNEDFTKVLWPEKYSKQRLLRIRRAYEESGNLEGYYKEYLNYPIAVEDAYYKEEDFNPIEDREEPLEFYTGVDLAISEKDRAAFSVFVTVGMNSQGRSKVVDVRRFRGDSLKICETFFSVNTRYKPIFIVESENIDKAIGPFLDQQMNQRGEFLSIEKITPSKDKELRGRSWSARMRAGAVEHNTEASWYPEYKTEMMAFPKSAYKDQADATHNVGMYLAKMIEAPTLKELEDEEWDEEYHETYELYDYSGANPVTGY